MTKPYKSTAKHVAIILDGNRRWATKQGLPGVEGHVRGRKTLRESVTWAIEAHLETLTVFAFSTENWNRSNEEVSALMGLFGEILRDEVPILKEQGVRLRVVGDTARLSEDLQTAMREAHESTQDGEMLTLYLAISYGGRAEILHAVNAIEISDAHAVTAEELLSHLWVPIEPDLIIRTGGERRLSNFLLWQGAYSELFFVDTLWPDFSREDFFSILEEFSMRSRRFGV